MTLGEMLRLTDNIVPNAYDPAVKTRWLNECEGMLLLEGGQVAPEALRLHRASGADRVSGLWFPDGATLRLPRPLGYAAGGAVTIQGLATYGENNSAQPRELRQVSQDGLTLTFAPESFAHTGTGAEAGTAVLEYDNGGEPLPVPPPYDRVYWLYLTAMLHFADGEYDRYQNSMALFNSAYGDYIRRLAAERDRAEREEGWKI